MSIPQMVMPRGGEPEALELQQQPVPMPGPGQVRVQVEATGMAFAEVQMLRGRYYTQPRFPFVPGYDLVGRVEALGPGVTAPPAGQRVAVMTRPGRGYGAAGGVGTLLTRLVREARAAALSGRYQRWWTCGRISRSYTSRTPVS